MNIEHVTPEMAAALSLANLEIANPKKTSANPFFKSKYADLSEVISQIRQIYATFGLSVIQSGGIFEDGYAQVDTVLLHSSGGSILTSCRCGVSKSDAQAAGAAMSYLRRYSLLAIACLAQEDDDGESLVRPVATRPANNSAEIAQRLVQSSTTLMASAEDIAEIIELVEQTGTDIEKFTVWNGGSLDTMTMAKFSAAKTKLLLKLS